MKKQKDFHYEPPETDRNIPMVVIGFVNPDSNVSALYESILSRFENYKNEIVISADGNKVSVEIISDSGNEKEVISDLDYSAKNLELLKKSELRGIGLIFGYSPASERNIIATRPEPAILITSRYKVEIEQ